MKTETKNQSATLTKAEIALKYYDLNLSSCKGHIISQIADSKKEEMALIIDDVEKIFGNYVRAIENIDDTKELDRLHNLKRMWKLDLIEKIVKF